MKINIKVTRAAVRDFEIVDTLLNEISTSIQSKVGWSGYKIDSEGKKRKTIFKEILEGEGGVFVAKIDQDIVGVMNIQLIKNIRHGWKRAHIEEFSVSTAMHRKGIGSEMIKFLTKYCLKNDIKVVKLMCGSQLTESCAFYEKNGFKFLDKGYRLEIK